MGDTHTATSLQSCSSNMSLFSIVNTGDAPKTSLLRTMLLLADSITTQSWNGTRWRRDSGY